MAQAWEQDWNRLPLANSFNVRDMGGYPTQDGGRTNYHRFLRSSSLSSITPEEADFLYKYGVRCMIDLRGQVEHDEEPNVVVGPDVETHHVPLFEYNVASLDAVDLNSDDGDFIPHISEVYGTIIERSREDIGRVFKIMAAAPEGVVLYNCTAGKDRTGTISFLLLMLVGVDKYDCIANYLPSRAHLMRLPVVRDLWGNPAFTPHQQSHLDAPYDCGEYIYGLINDVYGGAENYLLGAGVTPEELACVRDRLVG